MLGMVCDAPAVIGRAKIQMREIQHWWCDSDPFTRGSQRTFQRLSDLVMSPHHLPATFHASQGSEDKMYLWWACEALLQLALLLSSALVLGTALLSSGSHRPPSFSPQFFPCSIAHRDLSHAVPDAWNCLLYSFHVFSLTTQISVHKSFALGSHLYLPYLYQIPHYRFC